MPSRHADFYREKAEECRLHAAAAKYAEVAESWQKLAAQWERLARGLDAARQEQATPLPKHAVLQKREPPGANFTLEAARSSHSEAEIQK